MIRNKRIISLLIIASIFVYGCGMISTPSMKLGPVELPGIGEADEPELHDGLDDSLIGRFIRNVGTEEMDVLLSEPNHATNPGVPISHLLYLLSNSNLDKMITITKRIGANRTRLLINAMKRLGCNMVKYDDSLLPAEQFNIPSPNMFSECSLDDYNHLQLMVDMINGIDDIEKLAMLVNNESISSPPTASLMQHIEKLAFMNVYTGNTEKIFEMINGVIDPRDLVFFLDQMDNDINATEPWLDTITANIDSGVYLSGLYKVVRLNRLVTDPNKIFHLINGARTAPGAAYDAAQISYIQDKLVPVIKGDFGNDGDTSNDNDPYTWVLKQATMINKISDLSKMKEILNALVVDEDPVPPDLPINEIAAMVDMISYLEAPVDPNADPADNPAEHNSIPTLGYLIEFTADPLKNAAMTANVTPENMASLIMKIANSPDSQRDDLLNPDLDAAGKKLVNVVDNVYDIYDLIFQVNNVSNFDNMAKLQNSLSIASNAKLAVLINETWGANGHTDGDNCYDSDGLGCIFNDGINPPVDVRATGIGKMVYMIDNIDDLKALADLVEGITDIGKLSYYTNLMLDPGLVVKFINAVIADPKATVVYDMVALMNGVDRDNDIPKLARFVTDLDTGVPADLDAVMALNAAMLAPYNNTADQGIGASEMALLMNNLADVNAAGKLATYMLNIGSTLMYQSVTPNITALEGLVRTMKHGVDYNGQTFPGLGAVHVAVMINTVDDPAALAGLVNELSVESNVVQIGCGDRLEDPDFNTPCTALGLGW